MDMPHGGGLRQEVDSPQEVDGLVWRVMMHAEV